MDLRRQTARFVRNEIISYLNLKIFADATFVMLPVPDAIMIVN